MRRLPLIALLGAACNGPPEHWAADAGVPDGGAPDAAAPDAAPDAMVPVLGPALVLDDVHIAGLGEDPHAFSLFGQALNPQLEMAVESGQLLVGLELRGLDDPAGWADPELAVGLYALQDRDGDPSDNFDPERPELFGPGVLSLELGDASIAMGKIHAEGLGTLMGSFPLPLENPTIDGRLVATADGTAIRALEGGRLRGAVPASYLSFVPNVTMGLCQGATMLDALALGCPIQLQPEVDLDGDGLEKYFDDDGDGGIDRCRDGDGMELWGTSCPEDPRMRDGYRLIFVIHGVRAVILAP